MARKILLADDSITIQKVVELTFSDGDYEVTAVNNGAKAIQKLSEMRPDIVLSDIIMPEKNGYEVCEFIKSHPEFRSIPVVLLTGTFEPFDPERAEKAGCDAVVTKPFESQSLIHKIDELINASRSAAAASPQNHAVAAPAADLFAATPAAPPVAAWPPPTAPPPAPLFGAGDSPFALPPGDSPFDSTGGASSRGSSRPHESDVFEAPSAPPAPTSFAPPPASAPAFAPASEPEAFGGETRAFPRMSFEDLQQTSNPQPATVNPAPPAGAESSVPFSPAREEALPWDTQEPAAIEFGAETQAFPRMSFDDLQTTPPPTASSPAPAEDPWQTPEPEPQPAAVATSSDERHAFPPLNFEELPEPSSAPDAPAHEAAAASPPSVWDEQPAASSPWSSDDSPSEQQHTVSDDFSGAAGAPFADSPSGGDGSPFASEASTSTQEEPAHETQPAYNAEPESPPWSTSPSETEPEPASDIYEPAGNELSEQQIDRIARRVVQLMSDQLVRNIAWEVIPDMAEMVVKERVRQLEAEEN
jgi:CheY-like chemotaxis protein